MAVWRELGVTIQVPGEDLVLEGVWQAGSSGGAVVAPPHPEYGGSLENPVVNELAFGLHKADVPSLRFNWRGVGASQGDVTGDLDVAAVDYRAALEHMCATVEGGVAACGYSFGAATALRVAGSDPRIRRLILVAPPAQMATSVPPETLPLPVHVITGELDSFAPPAALQEWVDALPDGHLEVLSGVDHFFMSGGLTEVSAFAAKAVGS